MQKSICDLPIKDYDTVYGKSLSESFLKRVYDDCLQAEDNCIYSFHEIEYSFIDAYRLFLSMFYPESHTIQPLLNRKQEWQNALKIDHYSDRAFIEEILGNFLFNVCSNSKIDRYTYIAQNIGEGGFAQLISDFLHKNE